MWHLRRVYMEGVGHPDARFDPLLIDLSDAHGAPADGVLWLENMGGKTSWVSLVFSTLRPARREFLGSIRDTKKLEQYLGAADTGHIVLEWQKLGPPSPFPLDVTRLVTGQVLQWKGRRVDTDNAATQLVRRFYGFVPGEDLDFDRLPMRNEAGGRRSLRDYVAALAPLLEGQGAMRPTDNQRDWRRWLEAQGLDPEVYRYQLLMNADEGAVAEQFQWEDGNSFIRWALPYIVDPRLPEKVAGAVDKVRGRIVQRDPLRLEKAFCDRVAAALEEVAGADRRCHEATLDLGAAWDRTARLAARLGAGAEIARGEAGRADERCRKAAASARAVSAEVDRLGRRRAAALLRAAELKVAELEGERAAAAATRAERQRTVRAHAAAAALVERREVELALEQIERELLASESESAPLRAAEAEAARALSRKLTALRDRARAEAEAAEAEARALAAEAEAADRRELESAAAETEAAGREAAAEARLESLEADLERGRAAGWIEAGEEPAAAAERTAAAEGEAAAELQTAKELAARLAGERDAAEERFDAATRDRIAATVAAERAAGEAAVLSRELGELAGDARLVEAAQQSPFDPWHSPAQVLDRLRSAAGAAAADRLDVELAAAANRRAVRHLESHSLLPPRLEVEEALAALEAAEVSAYAGWQLLRDALPEGERAAAAAAHPAIADGVVLGEGADLEAAREALVDAAPRFPVAVAGRRAIEGEAADGDGFVVAGPEALYDEAAAAAELERRRAELDESDARAAEARGREEAARGAAARYEAFLETWPEARAAEVRGERERAAAALAEATAIEERATASFEDLRRAAADAAERVSRLGAALETARRRAADAAALATRHRDRKTLSGERAAAAAAREAAAEARSSARIEARQRRAAAAQERERGRRAEARRQQAAEELRRFDLTPSAEGEEPGDPPDVLARALEAARRALEQARGAEVLESERRNLEARRARLGADVDRHGAEVIAEAEALVSASRAQSEEQRAAEREAAERAAGEAAVAVGRIERDLDVARTLLESRALAEGEREALEETPATAGEAESLAAAAGAERDDRAAELASLAAERDRLEELARARGEDANQLEEAAGELAELLASLAGAAGREGRAGAADAVPFTGEVAVANQERRRAAAELRAASSAVGEALRGRQSALGGVDRAAGAAEFAELFVGAPLRERLLADPDDVRAAGAAGLARELRRRGATIERDLEEIEEHRRTLTTMLVGQVRSALQTLRQLQNQSRLPDGLDDWSGRHYLVIKHPDLPADPEQLAARIDTVIESICSSESRAPTDGLSLLWGGLRAGVGADFSVEILKPHKHLRNVRVPVSEIRTFSGGQKITAALVLFAALTRMRELNIHAGAIASSEIGATLILDNPIGKASAGTLIEVQRRVARRCGLQLVYTTGVSDLGALGAFTCVVRLDGKENLRTGAQHVTTVERQVAGLRLVQRDLDPASNE